MGGAAVTQGPVVYSLGLACCRVLDLLESGGAQAHVEDDDQEGVGEAAQEPFLNIFHPCTGRQVGGGGDQDDGDHHHAGNVHAQDGVNVLLAAEIVCCLVDDVDENDWEVLEEEDANERPLECYFEDDDLPAVIQRAGQEAPAGQQEVIHFFWTDYCDWLDRYKVGVKV